MKFPSKILLFGEHTVLHNSQALSIPFHRYFGEWKFGPKADDRLLSLIEKLDEEIVSVSQFKQDCEKGLLFDSSIPQQFGLGSSGALTAAIYHSYAKHQESDIHSLQAQLANIESVFHGKSSGTDALVSYTRSSIHSIGKKSELITENPLQREGFYAYLYNSELPRSAKTYIKKFGELASQGEIDVEGMSSLVNRIIGRILSSQMNEALLAVKELSALQFSQLPDFIPDTIKSIWKTGLDSGEYFCKICGAGGGGYFLIFSATPLQEMSSDQLIALNHL